MPEVHGLRPSVAHFGDKGNRVGPDVGHGAVESLRCKAALPAKESPPYISTARLLLNMARKADSPADAMTARQAAAALADLRADDERLTGRASALMNMIWGVVASAIFLAYAAADDLDGFPFFAPILWVPFVAAGIAITRRVWHAQAVYFGADRSEKAGARDAWVSWAFACGFLAVALGLVFGLPLVGIEWSVHAVMLVVNGLLALVMATLAKSYWCTSGYMETGIAGVAMVAAAVALGVLALPEDATGLLAGLAALAAWTGSGAVIYHRS